MHRPVSHQVGFAMLFALATGFFCARPASAARLLKAFIEQDAQVVTHIYYDDGGRADPATVWRYLGEPPIMVNDENAAVESDLNDPLSAQLDGDVQVRIQHGDRIIAQATLSHLKLCRSDAQTLAWHLPKSEVERTAVAAGLGPPSPPAGIRLSAGEILAVGGVALAILVCAVAALVIVRASRRFQKG